MAVVKIVPFPGQNGKSAYEIAVENGFQGSEQEWLASLQGGGGSADIADFVFTLNTEEVDGETIPLDSSMTINNHDMNIRTTREDDGTDADIGIYAADDLWLEAEGDEVRISAANDITLRPSTQTFDGDNEWIFTGSTLRMPNDSIFESEAEYETETQTGTTGQLDFNYLANSDPYVGDSVAIYANPDIEWFAINQNNNLVATVTFGDASSVPLLTAYSAVIDNYPVVIFQWATPVSVSYPINISGTADVPIVSRRVTLSIQDKYNSQETNYRFNNDGVITLDVPSPRIEATMVPNDITLSAYSGVTLEFADANGAGLRFPDNTVQTTAYTGGDPAPKTWIAPNDALYQINQAHGGVQVELAQPQSYGENITVVSDVTNSELMTVTVSPELSAIFMSIWTGAEYFRIIRMDFNSQTRYLRVGNPTSNENEWVLEFLDGVATTYANNTYYAIIEYGAPPVLWWTADNLGLVPEGDEWKFRGAKIEYHAYSQDSGTIVGTIYIADDSGDNNVTHIETTSGGNDNGNVVLWSRYGGEQQLYAYRADNESDTVKIHWTAQVYYGTDFWDD